MMIRFIFLFICAIALVMAVSPYVDPRQKIHKVTTRALSGLKVTPYTTKDEMNTAHQRPSATVGGSAKEAAAQAKERAAMVKAAREFTAQTVDPLSKRVDNIARQIGLNHTATTEDISTKCDNVTDAGSASDPDSTRGIVPGHYMVCASQVIHTRVRALSDYVGHPFVAAKTSVSNHLTSLESYINKTVWKPTEMGRKTVEAILVTGVKLVVQGAASAAGKDSGDTLTSAEELATEAGGGKK